MSLFWQVADHSIAYRLGWTLVHSIWQGALAAAIFFVARSMLRGRSADARYVIGCAALVVVAAAPVVTFSLSPRPFSLAHPQLGVGSIVNRSLPVMAPRAFSLHDSALLRLFSDGIRLVDGLLPGLVLGWIAGVVILSGRWFQGYWWARRVRTVQILPLDEVWLELLEDLKARFQVSRPVRLVGSALAEVPMVVGWLRPVILLPASSLTGLSPEQLEAVLAHELAHVRRCDYLVNAFQNLVETVMFYHPAVWWISHCVRQERENCCDDMVVRVCRDRLVYARALFRLEELRNTPERLALAATGGSLLNRIRRLVAPAKANGPITARDVAGFALGGIGCVLVVLGVYLLFRPEAYFSTVRIRLARGSAPLPLLQSQQTGGSYDPYFIQTEFEVIQSEIILGKVIEDLSLDKAWSQKYGRGIRLPEALELLKRQMDLRPVRNTSIVEIRIYDEDATQAAKIANQIAETYRDFRREEATGSSGEHVDTLVAQLKEQDAAIAGAQKQVARLRDELTNLDNLNSRDVPLQRLSAEAFRKIEELRIESQAEYVRSKVLLDNLRALTPDELVEAIPTTGIQDALLSQLVEQMALAKQKLAVLKTDYGPEATEVRRTANQIAELQQKITEKTKGFLLGLAARVDSLAQGLNNLSNEVARATQPDVVRVSTRDAYDQAKRELEERVRFRQMLYVKLASEKTEAQIPKSSPVQIVDRAFVSSQPVTPNRPRSIAFITAGALFAAFGFFLVRTGESRLKLAPVT